MGGEASGLTEIRDVFVDLGKEIAGAIATNFDVESVKRKLVEVDVATMQITKSFGLGRDNIVELKGAMTAAVTEVTLLGGKFSDIVDIQKDVGEIVGSFRRKEETSGDIDVMLNMDIQEFNKFIDSLIKEDYIKYTLARGDKKFLGICRMNKTSKYRRIDFIRNTPEEYPYMKLYFTGSANFNVAFRKHCLKLGLSLNEHSFIPPVKGLKTERDIFKYVGLEYVNPEDRIDENSLKFLNL